MSELGELIKEAKRLFGVSFAEIARKANVTSPAVRRIANGDIVTPNKMTVNAIISAIGNVTSEKAARRGEETKRMREFADRLQHVNVSPKPGHERWKRPPAARFLEVFCAAAESVDIEWRWLEIEADVSYATIKNFVRGRVSRPNPITAQLLGIAVVRRLSDEASKAWTQDRRTELLALAQGVKDAYKADYGDELM